VKILLIAAVVWIVILVGYTTYTVPHMYGEEEHYSVCNDIVNTCFFFDGKSIVKMEG
jgi:hypothetical protein